MQEEQQLGITFMQWQEKAKGEQQPNLLVGGQLLHKDDSNRAGMRVGYCLFSCDLLLLSQHDELLWYACVCAYPAQVHVLNGEKYKEVCPDNTLLNSMQLRGCIIQPNQKKPLLKRENALGATEDTRIFLQVEVRAGRRSRVTRTQAAADGLYAMASVAAADRQTAVHACWCCSHCWLASW